MSRRPKIAIIGPSASRDAGQFCDRTWSLWGLNAAYRNRAPLPWARMFNLHRLAHLVRDVPQYVEWDAYFSYRNPRVPMYVVDSWRGLLRNQVLFPRRALQDKPQGDYHASSFDWMVALAIHEGAQAIAVHGAKFAVEGPGQEPVSAWACLEYWLGVAVGRGIRVMTHADCELFHQSHLVRSRSVYGYDDVQMIEDRRRPRRGTRR